MTPPEPSEPRSTRPSAERPDLPAPDPAVPCAYVIVDMKISDHQQYRRYMAAAPAAVKAAGGEYLVRGGPHVVLEGHWQPARLAMLRFPSLAAAQAFYDDELYRAARAQRAGATEFFNMVVVQGVAEPV